VVAIRCFIQNPNLFIQMLENRMLLAACDMLYAARQ